MVGHYVFYRSSGESGRKLGNTGGGKRALVKDGVHGNTETQSGTIL